MIKNKKSTSKIASVLSAIIAVIMLGTTVFASGALSNLTTEDYKIEITNNGEKIGLINKPFIENGEVYLPIRETFEKVGIINDDENAIIYDNGKITVTIQANQLQPTSKYTYEITVGDRNIILNPLEASENMGLNVAYQLTNAPVLKDNITYIPYELTHYLFAGRYDVEIGYEVYDKNDNLTDIKPEYVMYNANNQTVVTSAFESGSPGYTIEQFFNYFAQSDFESMKRYCTKEFIDGFFGDGYVFGMERASLTDLKIDQIEYAKSSNDFNVFVTVTMEPEENSVYMPEDSQTSFNIQLIRQSDGNYLINEFGR